MGAGTPVFYRAGKTVEYFIALAPRPVYDEHSTVRSDLRAARKTNAVFQPVFTEDVLFSLRRRRQRVEPAHRLHSALSADPGASAVPADLRASLSRSVGKRLPRLYVRGDIIRLKDYSVFSVGH